MSIEVYIDYGTGWVELTDYDGAGLSLVHKEGFSKTEILHKDGESVINTCDFTTEMPVALATALMALDANQEIKLDIDKDGVNWFTGFARPITSLEAAAEDGYIKKAIQWSGVDQSWELKKVLSAGVSYTDYKICDPTDTGNSIVHALLSAAGVDSGDIDITTSITSTIPVFSLNSDDKEYFDILSDLLLCYGAALNVDSDGDYYVYLWADSDVPAAASCSIWGASESTFKAERGDADQERVQVKWRRFNSYTDRTLFSHTSTITLFLDNEGWPTEYPDDDSTEHPLEKKVGDDEIVKLSNLRLQTYITDLYPWLSGVNTIYTEAHPKKWFTDNSSIDYSYTNKKGVDYSFSGTWINVSFSPNLTEFKVILQLSINSTVSWSSDYDSGTCDINRVDIGQYRILGDVQTIGERWTAEVGSGARLMTFDAPYIFSQTDAENLAQMLLDLKKINSTHFNVRVDTDVPVGTYIRLQNDLLSIDTVVRVIRKIDNIGSSESGYQVYQYVVEVAEPLSVTTSTVNGGTFGVVPTAAEVGSAAAAALAGLNPDGNIIKAIEGRLIETGFTPTVDGLYFNDEFLGFYKVSDGDWTSRFKNDGTFKFLGNANNFLEWDGSQLLLQGDAQSANFETGVSGWQVLNIGNAEFNEVTVRGTVYASAGSFTGTIMAAEGQIGGWDISSTAIISENDRFAIRSDAMAQEIRDSDNVLRIITGWMGNAPAGWLNADGKQLDATDFGQYISGGNYVVADGARFENGDYKIQHDAAYIVYSPLGVEIERLGSLGAGDVGLDIGGMKFATQLTGGGDSDDTFETTLSGGGGSATAMDTVLGGGQSLYGARGLLYSMADGRLYLAGDAIIDGTVKAAKIDVDDLFAQDITFTNVIQSSGFESGAGGKGLKLDSVNDEYEFHGTIYADNGTFRGDLLIGSDDENRQILVGSNGLLAKDSNGNVVHDIIVDNLSDSLSYLGHLYLVSQSSYANYLYSWNVSDTDGITNISLTSTGTEINDFLEYNGVQLIVRTYAGITNGKAWWQLYDLDTYNNSSGNKRIISEYLYHSDDYLEIRESSIINAKIHNDSGIPKLSLYIERIKDGTVDPGSFLAIYINGVYK